ncbi:MULTISPECIES: 4a-hydroxytetrahydrobiopterin dehydratase [Parafrankia]|uniref:Putative pterin-4-alpha-carbinolamine dehydratase n=1 Tax=Parafrankia colletiae TaxID=573497 RepID=A0A1S1QAR8_9ACTN|nr:MULTISPECIES: 4a-hydroxytetrahydrobiopterin dehydratase [Parafrankia]MCK9903827.1 4a-hydroxytetrahydrobiopterin dehydratase [Frankia sp. Cpl3]OHV30561.1 pterin-4-alpha-carbinolamine dehydratase [Parafrankia colletiae]
MPTRLDNSAVATSLEALPGWIGDADRIRLEILVDGEEATAVVDEVMRAADEMDHHPVVEHGPGSTTFTVWTHSAGGVTELDMELARRISAILRSAGITF